MNWSVSLQGSAKGRRGTVKRGTMFKLLLCTLAVSYVSAAPVSVENIGVNATTVVAQPVCRDSHPGGNPRKCDLTCFSECCLGADDHDQAWLSECIDTSCGCAGFPSESCVCPTCDVTPGQSCQEDRDCDRAPGCGQWQCFFGTHHNGGCAGPRPTPPPAPPPMELPTTASPNQFNCHSLWGQKLCTGLNKTECQTWDSKQDACPWVEGSLLDPWGSCRCSNPELYCSTLKTQADCLYRSKRVINNCLWIAGTGVFNKAHCKFNDTLVHPVIASKTHYGDPKAGCLTDEQNITLQGRGNPWVVAGDFCSPKCQLPDPSEPVYKCPSDIPTGVTAKPQCAQIGGRQLPPFCALVCQYPIPHGLYECGANATCKRSSPPSQPGHAEGVCTYDD